MDHLDHWDQRVRLDHVDLLEKMDDLDPMAHQALLDQQAKGDHQEKLDVQGRMVPKADQVGLCQFITCMDLIIEEVYYICF